MHGLEPVADIRQGAAHDDAHGVIEVGPTHFVLDADLDDFSCEIRHRRDGPLCAAAVIGSPPKLAG